MNPESLHRLKNYFTALCVILCLERRSIASEDAPIYSKCQNKICGEFNITYPFWLNSQQSSYCGFPSFNINCENNIQPLVNLFGYKYNIKNISYEDQNFHISAPDYVIYNCEFPVVNLTSDLYPLSISPKNQYLYFLLNCSSSLQNYTLLENCSDPVKPGYYAGKFNKSSTPKLELGNSTCKTLILPVARSLETDYIRLLRNGWFLDWTLPDCSECSKSGGHCGYNNSEASFMCICKDRVHKVSCYSKTNRSLIIGVSTSIGILTLLGGIMYLLYKHARASSSKSLVQDTFLEQYLKTDPKMGIVECQTHIFTYIELQEATNSFASSNELGNGAFGTVYKGNLKDGRIVAIKRLYENNYKQFEQFLNEIKILSRLHHPNLVSLYGCASHQSRELLLVYEFVSNGTIADHLHGSRAKEGILTWPLRLNIAIETAEALTYLHAITPPIIHRDVKTNNILLDSSFHVKVADFGLSRHFPTNVTHVSTAPQGTPGYLDPEYHQCYQLTDKSDVYSFGVVLLELISSKLAVDITRQKSEINLASLANTKIQNGEVGQLVDPGLGYESISSVRMMISMVTELAFRCLQTDGDMRPPIKDVLDTLRAIDNEGNKVVEGGEEATRSGEDVGLLKNIVPFSPDSVINEWVSRSTTPNTSK